MSSFPNLLVARVLQFCICPKEFEGGRGHTLLSRLPWLEDKAGGAKNRCGVGNWSPRPTPASLVCEAFAGAGSFTQVS